jgi:hypothetical protein
MPVVDMNVGNGVAFLVGGTVVADLIAKACSSPQTAELNASARSATLMKWVNIGMAEAAVFIAVAAYIDPKHRNAIIAGGIMEGIITWLEYKHAKQSGLENPGEPTEQYPEGNDNGYKYSQA